MGNALSSKLKPNCKQTGVELSTLSSLHFLAHASPPHSAPVHLCQDFAPSLYFPALLKTTSAGTRITSTSHLEENYEKESILKDSK